MTDPVLRIKAKIERIPFSTCHIFMGGCASFLRLARVTRLLKRAEQLIDRSAEEIYVAHTFDGRWPRKDQYGAHRDYKELCQVAKELREWREKLS